MIIRKASPCKIHLFFGKKRAINPCLSRLFSLYLQCILSNDSIMKLLEAV